MNQESPFESYLSGRAHQIVVPSASGSGSIADRARSRRRRRRAGSGAVLGIAVLLGGAVIGQGLRSDEDAQEVESYGAAQGAPTLDWTMVDVGNGLGWTKDIVRSESGTLYAVSTSGGSLDSIDAHVPVVYSSTDGTDWNAADMPDDVRVNALAASGDTIYAVGTGAAGGRVRLASGAGGRWTVTDLPLDLEAESADLPGRLYVAETDVATNGGTTLVAATIALKVDTESLVATEDNPSEWYAERDGMVRWVCEGSDAGEGSRGGGGDVPSAASSIPGPSTSLPEAGLDELNATGSESEQEAFERSGTDPAGDCGESNVQIKTWAELGLDPAVGELVTGEVRLFTAVDGSGDGSEPSFTHAGTVPGTYGTQVVAADSGFWVLSQAPYDPNAPVDATEARWSADGVDWSAAPLVLDGARVATGEFDGAMQFLALDWSSQSVVLHRLAGGTASAVDLSDVVGLAEDRYFSAAEIGPLGVVIVIGNGSGRYDVLHSADGSTYGKVSTPAADDGKKLSVNGVTMSADAVKVRLNVYPDGDVTGGPPEAQRLFVGTPR